MSVPPIRKWSLLLVLLGACADGATREAARDDSGSQTPGADGGPSDASDMLVPDAGPDAAPVADGAAKPNLPDAAHGDAGTDGGACQDLLNDPSNCGACAHDCRGTACVDGHCVAEWVAFEQTFGTALTDPSPLFVDGPYLYLRDADNGGYFQADLRTQTVKPIPGETSLASYDGLLYTASRGEDADGDDGWLVIRAAAPETPESIALAVSWPEDSLLNLEDYAIGGGSLYAIDNCMNFYHSTLGGKVEPTRTAITSGCGTSSLKKLVLDDTARHAYVVGSRPAWLTEVDTDDLTVSSIDLALPDGVSVREMVYADGALYLATSSEPKCNDDDECEAEVEVLEIGLPGSLELRSLGAYRLATSRWGHEIYAPVVRGDYVYFGDYFGMTRFSRSGEPPLSLFDKTADGYQGEVHGFAVDDEWVYMETRDGLRRVAR